MLDTAIADSLARAARVAGTHVSPGFENDRRGVLAEQLTNALELAKIAHEPGLDWMSALLDCLYTIVTGSSSDAELKKLLLPVVKAASDARSELLYGRDLAPRTRAIDEFCDLAESLLSTVRASSLPQLMRWQVAQRMYRAIRVCARDSEKFASMYPSGPPDIMSIEGILKVVDKAIDELGVAGKRRPDLDIGEAAEKLVTQALHASGASKGGVSSAFSERRKRPK